MIVTIGGKHYEITGGGYGEQPVWQFIKQGGKPMTAEEFQSLPAAEQQELTDYVRQHLDASG
jgi:hypothetical protein